MSNACMRSNSSFKAGPINQGSTNFDSDERAQVPNTTEFLGVQIQDIADVKLFRYGANAATLARPLVTLDSTG